MKKILANKTTGNFQVCSGPQARCPPEKPANANTTKKNSANKTTGNFQVDAGPQARCPPEKPANANAMKKNYVNKNTGNFQVDTGPQFPFASGAGQRSLSRLQRSFGELCLEVGMLVH